MSSRSCVSPLVEGVALGLDVGGTKIAAGVVSRRGDVLGTYRAASPDTDNEEKYFDAVLECAHRALASASILKQDIIGIGCGCGAPMDWPAGSVSPINIPAWTKFPLRKRLAYEFHNNSVYIHNDAIALAVGEHWQGSAQGAHNMIAVTISTGVGAGLILNGELFHGKSGHAGHIGHVVVEPEGPPCKCGGNGCVEAIASGPNAVTWALSHGWIPPSGQPVDGSSLAQSAREGNDVAIRTLIRAGRAVGIALANCANLLDLELAVVSGGFSQSGPILWDSLRHEFNRHASMSFATQMRIIPSNSLRNVGIIGSAAFALMPERYGWPLPGDAIM